MNAVIYNSLSVDTQSIFDIQSLKLKIKENVLNPLTEREQDTHASMFNLSIIKSIYMYYVLLCIIILPY